MGNRFYVLTIQYNKVAQAENRTAPKAYDDMLSAKQEYHAQLGKDMANVTLGWSVVYILDSFGNVLESERWTREEEPTPEIAE